MASTSNCSACSELPIKGSNVAVKVRRCAECGARLGVTSYGAHFRMANEKARLLLPASLVMTGVVLGGMLAVIGGAVFVKLSGRSEKVAPQVAVNKQNQVVPAKPVEPMRLANEPLDIPGQPATKPGDEPAAKPRKVIKIERRSDDPFLLILRDPNIQPPLIEQMKEPRPPIAPDVALVREVSLQDAPGPGMRLDAAQELRDLIAKIRQENEVQQDGFLITLQDQRPELRGLPFFLGSAARLDKKHAIATQTAVNSVHVSWRAYGLQRTHELKDLWEIYDETSGDHGQLRVAALTQIFGPAHPRLTLSMIGYLSGMEQAGAGRAIARIAIFDPSADVRTAAIASLKKRSPQEYGDVLLYGLRYPLPSVSMQAAHAMIELKTKDLLPRVAALLDEPASNEPFVASVDGKPVHLIREAVRINHLRNCLLCHALAETGKSYEVPGLVPIPGSEYYSNRDRRTNDVSVEIGRGAAAVRADTTYLRQDFSLMMPVANSRAPGQLERFDFVVRTRVIDGDELERKRNEISALPNGAIPEQRHAAFRVLRELTGVSSRPTQAAWLTLLKKGKVD